MSPQNPYQATPWQVKFTYAFGIPAVIALYLIYYQTNRMDANQAELNKNITSLTEEVRNLRNITTLNKEQNVTLEEKYNQLLNMMVRVCATTAETNVDRNACFNLDDHKGTTGEYGGIKPYVGDSKK